MKAYDTVENLQGTLAEQKVETGDIPRKNILFKLIMLMTLNFILKKRRGMKKLYVFVF